IRVHRAARSSPPVAETRRGERRAAGLTPGRAIVPPIGRFGEPRQQTAIFPDANRASDARFATRLPFARLRTARGTWRSWEAPLARLVSGRPTGAARVRIQSRSSGSPQLAISPLYGLLGGARASLAVKVF